MINKSLFSSASDMWGTPQKVFDALNNEFHFDLDVCAIKENAKCKKFFSPEDDGLSQTWKGNCFLNPPYGREISKWVARAYRSVMYGEADVVVGLLPARTDTKYFHEYIYGKAEIRFIKGRLKFNDGKGSAPFPSMIVIWRAKE